jgi:hypothetical protein
MSEIVAMTDRTSEHAVALQACPFNGFTNSSNAVHHIRGPEGFSTSGAAR